MWQQNIAHFQFFGKQTKKNKKYLQNWKKCRIFAAVFIMNRIRRVLQGVNLPRPANMSR